ncbi:MAG: Cadmium, cobalt and zinc/H(+)-K(+) antiporter [bacterium ADurb.Bin429]|nr:MAG: Cadmium, cobalt and zinc/H(+)-K(+) antiporter [bacterium ADurb.Bin429]
MTAHEHECEHENGHAGENRRRLTVVLILTGVYLIAEVVGGLLTNSLALLSDAGHMLTDVGALALALFALWFAQRPASPRKTYGFYRLEILAALFNGIALLGLSVFIIVDAVRRLSDPPEVVGLGLLLIASGGLVVNLIGAVILHRGHAHSLNVRAAFYHLLGDLLGSLGAVTAGVLILAFGWYIADPLLAIGIAALIIVGAVSLLREATDVLLEATPAHVKLDELREALLGVPGVTGVHDLHVWSISSGRHALSCHVVVTPDAYTIATLEAIRTLLRGHCAIAHQTVQLETAELAAEEDIHV